VNVFFQACCEHLCVFLQSLLGRVSNIDTAVMLFHCLYLLILGTTIHAVPQAPFYQWQSQLTKTPNTWEKYVRSPPSEIVHPARIISFYTTGNVTNPNGLITGKGSTIFTRKLGNTSTDLIPTVVVDFGQNIAGYLSINFDGSSNSTPGLPGIRLAFSETLEYLTNVSDFSRSYNVST
jgi:hypothetical protein